MKKILYTLLLISPLYLKAHTQLMLENFDANLALPATWQSIPAGWEADSSNSSTGYTGASGLNNLVIKNLSATGVYELRSPAISTLGYKDISISWGARHTINFPLSGSAITSVDFSIDNGTTWTTIPFTQNPSNSTWSLINNATRITLPSTADNQASVILRWVANIVNSTDGTYRIDDFSVEGNVLTSVPSFIVKDQISIAQQGQNLQIHNATGTALSLAIFDLQGRLLAKEDGIHEFWEKPFPFRHNVLIIRLSNASSFVLSKLYYE